MTKCNSEKCPKIYAKTLKQHIRDKFGNENVVWCYYNLIQEKATIDGIRDWLEQKDPLTRSAQDFKKQLLEELKQ